MAVNLLNPGCGGDDCYPCTDCTCFFRYTLSQGTGGDICKVNTSVKLIHKCGATETELDLDDYGVTAKVTGDEGVLWAGDGSDLPAQFDARYSDDFELELNATLDPGYYPECSSIDPVLVTLTVTPSCKECVVPGPCECLDGLIVAVPDVTVTISGTTAPTHATFPPHVCAGGTFPVCADIRGTYIVPCDSVVHWFVVYEYVCTWGSIDIYHCTLLTVEVNNSFIDVKLSAGQAGGTFATGVVISGTGTPPSINSNSVGPRKFIQKKSYECRDGVGLHSIALCEVASTTPFPGSAPGAGSGHCDLRGLTITIVQ